MGWFDLFVPRAVTRMTESYGDLYEYQQGRLSADSLRARAKLREQEPKGPLETLIDFIEDRK